MGPIAVLDRPLAKHLGAAVVLLFLTAVAYGHIVALRPFDADSLGPLSWAFRANALSFIQGNVVAHPEWRPLPYLTFWIQYQLVGLGNIESWFLFNILLWGLCGCLVYALAYTISHSQLAGLVAAAVLLLDPRVHEQLVIITGRQMVFASLFGLAALLLALFRPGERWPRLRRASIFALLLLAALSKEPGLAFSAALLTLALLARPDDWRALGLTAFGAIAAYFALRFLLAGGALGDYCEDIGFFDTLRPVCYKELSWSERIPQYLYNQAAMLIGTLLRGVISSRGRVDVNLELLLPSLPWFLLAVVGWLRSPRRTLPLLVLIAANAAVSFAVYRTRNQIYGLIGLYVTASVGLTYLLSLLPRWTTRWIVIAATIPSLLWLGGQAQRADALVQREIQTMRRQDPCSRLNNTSRYERAVIVELKHKYALSNPDCRT
jgi:hypothetical protein